MLGSIDLGGKVIRRRHALKIPAAPASTWSSVDARVEYHGRVVGQPQIECGDPPYARSIPLHSQQGNPIADYVRQNTRPGHELESRKGKQIGRVSYHNRCFCTDGSTTPFCIRVDYRGRSRPLCKIFPGTAGNGETPPGQGLPLSSRCRCLWAEDAERSRTAGFFPITMRGLMVSSKCVSLATIN